MSMAGLPFFESDEIPAATAPGIEIEVVGGGSDDGFGGLAAAADALLGGGDDAQLADHLVSLSLLRSMAPLVDELALTVAQTERAPVLAIGDTVIVRMGVRSGRSLAAAFRGHVYAIEDRSDGCRGYRIGNAGHTLAGVRMNQAISSTSVEDAVSFIVSDAGLALNAALRSEDASLAQYIIDDGRSAWDHVATLAHLLGANVWVDASDTVRMADELEDGEVVASYDLASNVLESRIWERAPHAGAITVFGGARAGDGHTLRKQGGPNRGEGGDGAPQRIRRQGALGAPEDLATHAAALGRQAHRRTTRSEMLLPGSTALAPGAVIEVAGTPRGTCLFLIQSAHHAFDQAEGWRTRVTVSEAGEVPGFAGLLGGALGGLL